MKLVCRSVEYHIDIIGQGEPLLLLHGFTGSLETWRFLGHMLKKYQLIMVDIIGHGSTGSPDNAERYTMLEVAKDLREILEKLSIQKIHVLGYSMGGRLALGFACLYPEYVQSLILESASPGLKTETARQERRIQDAKLANKIIERGILAFVADWENIPLFDSQKKLPVEKQQSVRKERLGNTELGLANSLLGMGTGSQPSWWSQLENLSMPILLITGELDNKFCDIAKMMQSIMKACEWQIINNAGHAIHVEDEEKFGKIVSEFLTKQLRRI
ncbi:2-succinyl-6-hydroxy-2,4-cyclohexadiene-1-carboxylate synthase [Bacillus cihuensis]|uniref:2-succinyl-6-hydroxy-2, 4-cyclohexadiene-1-carboxylate synthase n=1 Tax=Bacillus cihuensis TaxID=1208599 RepID=UPI0004901047|nr:2-succinyl-6-hydroxy-2,4-cyclohexadiene-1-carboxylate synthase [Bacillus cihuensis]